MKDVFIGIVSHGHDNIIENNFTKFPKIIGKYKINIGIIDNINSENLKNFCQREGIFYYADTKNRGYGENVNKIFSLLNPKDDDIFIVCNPDILIPIDQLEKALLFFEEKNPDILALKVYRDKNLASVSSQNRRFPCILDFIYSFLTSKRPYMKNPDVQAEPDWISGAFMIWKSSSFRKIKGFDESYFMYCEDIDICYRAKKVGMKIIYNPNFYIIHESQLESRNLLSRQFFWHVNSVLKFIIKNKIFCLKGE